MMNPLGEIIGVTQCHSLFGVTKHNPMNKCEYVEPTQPVIHEAFFQDLIVRGKNEAETFESMLSFFWQSVPSYHHYQFKFPLNQFPIKDSDAQVFAKVLQIKAQQAHHFVLPIALSTFISASRLGFDRQINIVNGPTIREHLLVDRERNQVIFIEETVQDESGQIRPGSFAAVNEIVKEEGTWYFVGTYLYDSAHESHKIETTKQMFQETYENIMSLIEKGEGAVDAIYHQLSEF